MLFGLTSKQTGESAVVVITKSPNHTGSLESHIGRPCFLPYFQQRIITCRHHITALPQRKLYAPVIYITDEEVIRRDIYDDGYLRVEHDNYYVECKGELIDLSRAEFLIFSCLVRSPNCFVQSETIWRAAWRDKKPYNADSLHVIMYRLRRRFAPFGFHLDNKVAVGYRLSFKHTPHVGGATETSAVTYFFLHSSVEIPAPKLNALVSCYRSECYRICRRKCNNCSSLRIRNPNHQIVHYQ
ncbi:MAG: helix-turn-helix domain-containing protein [Pyrinomonadaceae bacterium]|nr:helix-turn-helix domain-containing protein [Pyrinomonadaceae bacterium]